MNGIDCAGTLALLCATSEHVPLRDFRANHAVDFCPLSGPRRSRNVAAAFPAGWMPGAV